MSTFDRLSLRQALCTQRRAVDEITAQTAAKQLALNLLKLPIVEKSQHIAGYLAHDGEISPAYLAIELQALGKNYYLPVLDPEQHHHLLFVRYKLGDELKLNRYKIPEPTRFIEHQRAPTQLDLVLVPLVAFDEYGTRLGMGGGFYDRTFEFIQVTPTSRPLLIGLAYKFQRVKLLEKAVWDVPLDAVVTEQKVYSIVYNHRFNDYLSS